MKKIVREQAGLVFLAALCLAAVLYLGQIWGVLVQLTTVFAPVLLGGILAFIFNVPMKRIEGLLAKWKVPDKFQRGLAIVSVLLLFALIVAGIVAIVVPTLTMAVGSLTATFNKFVPDFLKWLETTGLLQSSQIKSLTDQLNQSGIIHKGVEILSSMTGNVTAIFGNFFTVLMAVFLMLSMLGSKEQLANITVRLMRVLLPQKTSDYLRYAGNILVETYNNFLMGQMIEAVIIGVLIFTSYSLAGLPYAAMTGVLAGVLSFIPYIGPFTACGLGAVFIFTVNPMQALLSIVVYQLVQLVEGNVIYPRVVGSSIGLPGLFTLAAALIGGNLFGLVGMIFFTPIFAVFYRLVKEWVLEHEQAD